MEAWGKKTLLHDHLPAQLEEITKELGQPRFRARQLLDWLYLHPVVSWNQMTNIPGPLLDKLKLQFDLMGLALVARQVSTDGTRKFLFQLRDGATVESVIIPMADHATFCISSQVGCAMACRFCATARGGLVRNLAPGEIVQQVLLLQRDLDQEPLAHQGGKKPNVVFMGMGEPLDNFSSVACAIRLLQDSRCLGFSHRRIQISTSGPRAGLERLRASDLAVGLTLSIGGSNDQERRAIMPVPGRTPLRDVLDLAESYARRGSRRPTVAWVLIAGQTDLPEQAQRLARLLCHRPFKVNLIPLNPLDDGKLEPPELSSTLAFQSILTSAGVDTFIRASGGRDIAAACGQLRKRHNPPT